MSRGVGTRAWHARSIAVNGWLFFLDGCVRLDRQTNINSGGARDTRGAILLNGTHFDPRRGEIPHCTLVLENMSFLLL